MQRGRSLACLTSREPRHLQRPDLRSHIALITYATAYVFSLGHRRLSLQASAVGSLRAVQVISFAMAAEWSLVM